MANFALKICPESLYLDFVVHAFKKKTEINYFPIVQGSLRYPECRESLSHWQMQEKWSGNMEA